MADPSTSIAKTHGGFDQQALMQRIFSGIVPYQEWASRYRHGAALDLERIDSAIRSADSGIMWPLTDMSREAISLNPKAQGIAAKAVLPLANADYDLTPAEGDGIAKKDAERIATFVRAAIAGIENFDQARLDLGWGFFDGRAALETLFAPRNARGETWPRRLDWIVPQRLSYGPERELIIVDRWGDWGQFARRGPALRDVPGKFITFTPRMYADLQEREGLAPRFLYWLFFDRFTWRNRFKLTESFGFPWRIIEQAIAETWAGLKLPRGDGGEGGAPGDDGAALDYTKAEAEAVTQDGVMVLLPGQKAQIEYPPPEVNEFFTMGSDKILERLEVLALHAAVSTDATRANAVVLKSPEDILYEFRAKLVSAAIQTGLVNILVELNFGAAALPYAPKFQIRTKPERDRDKEVDRVLKVAAAVPVGAGVLYEASGYRAPDKGEGIIITTQLTPTDVGAVTRVDEARAKIGQPPVGGEVGSRWVIEHSSKYSAFGQAAGEATGAQAAPVDPDAPTKEPPALPRGEGSSEDAIGALRDLLDDADLDDQEDAADADAAAVGMARLFARPDRKVQPSSANGSPEVIIERGAREGLRRLSPWTDALLDAADSTDAGRLYRNLERAVKSVDVEPFARAIERRLALGLMLGGLDAHHEMTADVTVAPVPFAMFAGGVPDFTTMPFAEAIKIFKGKQVVTRKTFDRLLASAKQRAFTVAGLTKKAMLDTAHAELARALENGDDLRTFRSALSDRFDSAGWTQLNPSHVENIFRTNIMGAYSDGRRAQMTQPAVLAARPYWQILGVDDSRTRPTHKRAHGKVLPASDPFFDRSGPPFGFQCRCRIISRSAKDLQRLGLTPTIGAQLTGLPDPGWQADAIAEPFVAEDSAPPLPPTKKEPPRVPAPVAPARPVAPLEDLPTGPLPRSAVPVEGLDAYKKHQAEQAAKLAPDEREAVQKFTYGYDWAIREIDKGKSDAEILKSIESYRATAEEKNWTDTPEEHLAAAKKAHGALNKAIRKMQPVSERVVFRGLRKLDRATFDAIRTAEHVDIGAVSSTTWNANMARDFAGLDAPEPGTHQVLFALKTRSGYAIEEMSEMPDERELLLPKGTRFKVTRVYRPEHASDSAVIIEAEEL